MNERVENDVVAELAEKALARELVIIAEGREVALVVPNDHNVESFDLEQYQDFPNRMTGSVRLADAESFIEYANRHATPQQTTVWADEPTAQVTAVLNDHTNEPNGAPGWGDHRAVLTLRQTEDWTHWAGHDGTLMQQRAFAEHIEDGADVITEPSAAEMLEIAQTFHAHNNVTFRSSSLLHSGEVQLVYAENIESSAGRQGEMTIPRIFEIGIAPFEGGEPYRVQVRFRHRIVDGKLQLSYKMIRPDKVRKAAFADVLSLLSNGLGLPVLAGVPRS